MKKMIINFVALSFFVPSITYAQTKEPFDTMAQVAFDKIYEGFNIGISHLSNEFYSSQPYRNERSLLTDPRNFSIPVRKTRLYFGQTKQQVDGYNSLTSGASGVGLISNSLKSAGNVVKFRFNQSANLTKQFDEIVKSITPHVFSTPSALNISLQHSPVFGATLITWDDKSYIKGSSCLGTSFDPQTGRNTTFQVFGSTAPAYEIYRIVDGVQTLITKVAGTTHVNRNLSNLVSQVDAEGWNAFAKQLSQANASKLKLKPGRNGGRLSWVDLHSDFRTYGSTLSYKVVAIGSKINGCIPNERWEATIPADVNGDGFMDFIPEIVYSDVFLSEQQKWTGQVRYFPVNGEDKFVPVN